MSIYAIADLHLSGHAPKPMDIFGGNWNGHWEKIQQSWNAVVGTDDLVLLPGDLSWAMRTAEAVVDLDAVCAMPGTKIIMKGNHDYWWGSLSQVQALLTNDTYALQNNSFVFGDVVVAGSRGWLTPLVSTYDAAVDEKLYMREAARLELSLKDARKKAPDAQLVGMMHYPPTNQHGAQTLFTDLFEKYDATHVVYGHLHADGIKTALSGNVRGVAYALVSCDALKFEMAHII